MIPISQQPKHQLIKQYPLHQTHTPSPQLQIPLLTPEITPLNDHLPQHNKHHHSPPPLLKILPPPPHLLNYLPTKHIQPY
ncbi:30S ribosomal protein S15, partial [Staphylococcus epidermidis]|uniref:30S ribosomal protein S15 n=1 Tax=Staphylococcus epidermidis TaxID=1282 RepID=UPI0037DA55C1